MVLALAPGNWAEWFGAIAAGLAFLGTTTALLLEVDRRRRERREAHFADALAVTVHLGAPKKEEHVWAYVHNGARHPITSVELTVLPWHGQRAPMEVHVSIRFVQANETGEAPTGRRIEQLHNPNVPLPETNIRPIQGQVTMTFEDTAGTRWRRDPEGRVQRWRPARLGNKGKWLTGP